MFRFLLLILGLAAFGAYSLLEKAAGPSAPAALATSSEGGFMAGLGNLALSAASNASGLNTAPLPETGCAASALSPENINALLNSLPDAQGAAVSALLANSSQMLAVEWYSGELGQGICVPGINKVVLFPLQITQTINSLVAPAQ